MAIAETFASAFHLHQQGQWDQAKLLYRNVLEHQPTHADALHLLGLLLFQTEEQFPEAISLIRQAIQYAPTTGHFYNSLGNIFFCLKQYDEAISAYQKVIELNPDIEDGYLNLSMVFQEQGHLEEALLQNQLALEKNPESPEGWNNLGNALKALSRFDDAKLAYHKAIQWDEAFFKAYYNLAVLFQETGLLAEGLDYCQKAIALCNEFPEAYETLGELLYSLDRHTEAQEALQNALALNPDSEFAHCNLATVYLHQGNLLMALHHYEAALSVNPHCVGALYGMGNALAPLNKMTEARQYYQKAISIESSEVHADAARVKATLFYPFIYQSTDEINHWRKEIEESTQALLSQNLKIQNPITEIGRTHFYLPYQGLNDRNIQVMFAQLFTPKTPYELPKIPAHRKPRIGFISKYFRKEHTIGKIMQGIIEHFDREAFEVVLFIFADGLIHSDLIPLRPEDPVVELPLSDQEAAAQAILAQELDVLLYTDIGMEPTTYFLAMNRLAPIQCVTWGHPSTTGIPTIDYYLTYEGFESENHPEHYSEQPILLDNIPAYYYRPSLGAKPRTREYFGFSPTEHLYVCPQSLYKLHPDFDTVLGPILRRDPMARALFFDGLQKPLNNELMRRWHHTLPDVVDRIQFLGRMSPTDFYNVLALADVILDPLHFGGGNTSLEALSFGTPIVTWPREFMKSRFTYGFYKKMGIMDCVAKSAEEYADIALRLGTDPNYRAQIRQKILDTHDILYENPAIVRELERFFLEKIHPTRTHS